MPTESPSEWRVYRRIGTVTARPYVEGELLPEWVSISDADGDNGSPKVGDMIARDALTLHDEWLISAEYFACHYEGAPEVCDVCGDQFSDLAGHKALGVQTHPWLLAGKATATQSAHEEDK